MRLKEITGPAKPKTPLDMQADAIKRQQKQLQVKKKNLQLQKAREKANALQQQKLQLLNKP
jgi:hypothetical protein